MFRVPHEITLGFNSLVALNWIMQSVFDRVLCFVGPVHPSLGPSVGLSINHTLLFCVFAVFGVTAPAQMLK